MRHTVNLLPQPLRRRDVVRRCVRQWSALWGLTALLASAVLGLHFLGHGKDNARANALTRQEEQLRVAQGRLAESQSELLALRHEEAVLLRAEDDVSGLLVLGAVSRCAREADGSLQIREFVLSRQTWTGTAAAVANATPENVPDETVAVKPPRVLTLRGIAADGLAVATFTTALRDAGVFQSVEREPSTNEESASAQPVSYRIQCTF